MSRMPKQKVELIAVIALVLIAAAVAYFRFGRKASHRPRPNAATVVVLDETDTVIPDVPDWIDKVSSADFQPRPAYTPPPRDIFEPVDRTQVISDREPAGGTVAMTRIFRLSGTMRGAEGILAVINGKIVSTGETIGKYTVGEIEGNSVILLHPEGDIHLTPIDAPPPEGSRL
jgi:hypothetical protein